MKVVIVGGGTAAWMAAAALAKTFPHYNITLIKGGDPIGVGESTTPHINQYLKYMGIVDKTFLLAARATYKSSSRFENFTELDHVFHYPNGQSQAIGLTDATFHDWMCAKAYGLQPPPFADVFMPFVTVAEEKKMPINNSLLFPYDLSKDRSFHIDGSKFSAYLQETFCSNVRVVDSEVKSVSYKAGRIQFITVERGETDLRNPQVDADLYLDCTGQKSTLGGAMTRWIDFPSIPTDTAVIRKREYTDKDKEMVPYTNAKGMSAGWMWTIPTWDYISEGYVFSSKYRSPEGAMHESGLHNGKVIKFRNGKQKEAWVGNCVMIGLSYSFIEPLESTSLFSAHHGILALCDSLREEPGINKFMKDRFNHNMNEHVEGWKEFVEAHYYYSRRTDTEFWEEATQRTHYEPKGAHDLVRFHMVGGDPVQHEAHPILYILGGAGYTTVRKRSYQYFDYPSVSSKKVDEWVHLYERRKKLAESLPTMYKYLKENFYS